MPQIGWFEILLIVVVSILVIGPKDFPIVLRKIGNWIASVKKYFSDIQRNITDVQTDITEEIPLPEDFSNKKSENKKNE